MALSPWERGTSSVTRQALAPNRRPGYRQLTLVRDRVADMYPFVTLGVDRHLKAPRRGVRGWWSALREFDALYDEVRAHTLCGAAAA